MLSEIVIVSGLPRSGTSLMMQMLAAGGVPVVTDQARTADVDNPRGYYELERVKRVKQDAAWLPQSRGKAFKMISQLLYDLPDGERYRVIFMSRDLEETLASQETMLRRLGREAAPREAMREAYQTHLEGLHAWLAQRANFRLLPVCYNDLLAAPAVEAARVSAFLDGVADAARMADAVDPSLYRNRAARA